MGCRRVVRAPDGRPGIIVPDGEAPTEVIVQTIKKGDGPVVTGDEPVRVHYTGVLWDDRTVFDTTWDGDPASLTLDAVVPGFAQALEGQTVGSQVMVVVPPDAGLRRSGAGVDPGELDARVRDRHPGPRRPAAQASAAVSTAAGATLG